RFRRARVADANRSLVQLGRELQRAFALVRERARLYRPRRLPPYGSIGDVSLVSPELIADRSRPRSVGVRDPGSQGRDARVPGAAGDLFRVDAPHSASVLSAAGLDETAALGIRSLRSARRAFARVFAERLGTELQFAAVHQPFDRNHGFA